MPRADHSVLVTEFIEKLSGEIFEARYRQQFAELIRGHAGIYALYRGDSLYYVGLASDLMRRVDQHNTDHHRGKWDRFSVYLTGRDEHMKPLESLLLRVFRPPGNGQAGKLPGATDGKRALEAAMRRRDAEVRNASLYAEDAPRRRRATPAPVASTRGVARTRTAASTPTRAATPKAAAPARALAMQAVHKQTRYTAVLNKDGSVRYDGHRYPSLSAAASAVTGRPTNGWLFWRIRDDRGEWVVVNTLRK